MRQLICLIILATVSICSFAQKKTYRLDENSVIKDSSGRVYKIEEWKPLLQSREYIAVAVNPKDDNTPFVLQRVTDDMRRKWIENSPKPRESAFFTTGEPFRAFKAKTIDGEKIDIKELKGKILVINYWFINCMPCRKEIPELNELVKRFENDTSVVFLSIAKDSGHDLKNFLKAMPFSYKIVGYNRGGEGVSSFPTNVVVDKQGNVAFHSSGYSSYSVHWIGKTIEELKKAK